MQPRAWAIGLLLLAAAGCAPVPATEPPSVASSQADAASAGAAEPGAPADPGEPDMKPVPPTDVRVMKCSVINAASDDDKAYAATFLLGYRSAMAHMHTIDTRQIDAILQTAVADCAAKPDALAYKVFAEAQTKAILGEHPPHRLLHKRLTATPAAASPEAPAAEAPSAEPGASPEPPPMRYAPGAPLPEMPPTGSPSEGSPE